MSELGEGIFMSLIRKLKTPVVKGEVVEVTFKSDVKVAIGKATVKAPHWKKGSRVNDGLGSKRPAVYLVKSAGGPTDVEVKVKIKVSKNASGNGKLIGSIGNLAVEGECPLGKGTHTVKAKIVDPPDDVRWYRGDMTWGIEADSIGQSISLNATRVEVFTILATPPAFFQGKKGVWAEALRFLCASAGVVGASTEKKVAEKVARYCHGSHRLMYDSAGGGRSLYGVSGSGGSFKLGDYLGRKSKYANCYDQAGAIQTLCGALGVKLGWYFLQPYGFIELTALLGFGACNNPFFAMNGSPPVISRNDPRRTPFGNHAFCHLNHKILDACAGPHIGDETPAQYVAAGIDDATTLYAHYQGFRPGRAVDIVAFAGVTDTR